MAQTYLTYKDYQALSKTLTDTAEIAPAYQSSHTITRGTISATTSVTGVTEDYIFVHTYEAETGRGISANDRAKLTLSSSRWGLACFFGSTRSSGLPTCTRWRC